MSRESPSGATPILQRKVSPRWGFCRLLGRCCYRYIAPLGLSREYCIFFYQYAASLGLAAHLFLSGMANTYTQIHLHIVFAVKGRISLVPLKNATTLYRYITGIITQQGQKLLAINGMPDHVHLLIGLRPDKALSDLMREVKANSAKFINEQRWVAGKFAWQEGFGAFSYSASQLTTVINYIERQQEHHATRTFQEEYRLLLERFGVDYNPAYLFTSPDDPMQ